MSYRHNFLVFLQGHVKIVKLKLFTKREILTEIQTTVKFLPQIYRKPAVCFCYQATFSGAKFYSKTHFFMNFSMEMIFTDISKSQQKIN